MKNNPAQEKKGNKSLFYIIGVLIIAAFFTFFAFNSFSIKNLAGKLPGFRVQPTPGPTSTPTPTPFPIAQGKQTYNVSRGPSSKGPNITQVIVDPFDPKKGEIQSISVKVGSGFAVKSVSVTLKTDHAGKTYDLKLTKGKTTDGIWEGSWTTEDTHDYIYKALVSAQASEYVAVELSFR